MLTLKKSKNLFFKDGWKGGKEKFKIFREENCVLTIVNIEWPFAKQEKNKKTFLK